MQNLSLVCVAAREEKGAPSASMNEVSDFLVRVEKTSIK